QEAALDQPPVPRETRQVLRQVAGADVVQHDVDTASVGELAHASGEVLRAVVDRSGRAEIQAASGLFAAPDGAEAPPTLLLQQEDGGRTHAPPAAVDERPPLWRECPPAQ